MKILIVFLIVIAVNYIFRALAVNLSEYFSEFFFGWMGGILVTLVLMYLGKRKIV